MNSGSQELDASSIHFDDITFTNQNEPDEADIIDSDDVSLIANAATLSDQKRSAATPAALQQPLSAAACVPVAPSNLDYPHVAPGQHSWQQGWESAERDLPPVAVPGTAPAAPRNMDMGVHLNARLLEMQQQFTKQQQLLKEQVMQLEKQNAQLKINQKNAQRNRRSDLKLLTGLSTQQEQEAAESLAEQKKKAIAKATKPKGSSQKRPAPDDIKVCI